MRYVIDTNIISEFISKSPNQAVLDFINSLDERDIYLSVITIGEVKFGIQNVKSESRKVELINWLENDLLTRFSGRILDIDTPTMLKWGEINQQLKSIGRPIPIMDSLIASSSIVNEMTLVTRNVKDFYNFDIDIINPFV